MEITKIDRLFAAKAVLKEAEKKVKELEAECKDELLSEYMQGGTDRKRSPFFGKESGYMGVTDGKKSEVAYRTYIADEEQVLDWMDDEHPDCEGFARMYLEKFCEWWLESTGECIPGFVMLEYETEPTKPSVRLVVKEKVVIDKLRESGELDGIGQYLLGDGE